MGVSFDDGDSTKLKGADDTVIGNDGDRLKIDFPPSVVAATNSTASTLTAGSTFTGAWIDVLQYQMVSLTVRASHASAAQGVKIEWSTNGTDVDADDLFSHAGTHGDQWSFGITTQYMRVRYTNGGTNQTSFRLQTILHRNAHKPSSHRIGDDVEADDDAELMKTVLTGQKISDGSYKNVSVDDDGNLIVNTPTAAFAGGFNFGVIQTSSATEVQVLKTAYTEQSSNAQRSIVSTSTNDSSAGTGARTVRITFLKADFTGPFTEDITMNGTTAVDTASSEICYIERIEVLTVGSTGSNVGTLNLKTTTGGGGSTFASVAATDNTTLWAHHYVPTGKVANITGISLSNDKSSIDSGGQFRLKAKVLDVANAVDEQITETLRYFAQDSTYTRNYSSPIVVAGPARICGHVLPDNGTNMVSRCAFDFYEQ